MRKAIVGAFVLMGLLAVAAVLPTVQSVTPYVANMSPQGTDHAKARACCGPICEVQSGWGLWFRHQYTSNVWHYQIGEDFALHNTIQGTIHVILDAPGIFDQSYYELYVYHNFAWVETFSGSSGGVWDGWVNTGTYTIGTSGTWTFVIVIWGLDQGNLQCAAQGEFSVYDI